MPGQSAGDTEYLIEIVTVGAYAKASAMDPVTGTEVSVMGPANSARDSLTAAAVAKLKYVLNKRER